MIVVDASAVTELLLQTPLGRRVEERLFEGDGQWHAPHLLDVEVVSALRRLVRAREVSTQRAEEAIEDLGYLRIVRHGHHDLVGRAWHMRQILTPYDAVYAALAEALDAPLVTCDGRLAAAPGHAARIEFIADDGA